MAVYPDIAVADLQRRADGMAERRRGEMLQLLSVIEPQAKASFDMLAVAGGHGAQIDGIMTNAAIRFPEFVPSKGICSIW